MESITKTPNRVPFDVADITPATKKLPAMTLRKGLEQAGKFEVLTCSKPNALVVKEGSSNPLIASAALAFKHHYPLVLSPDMIWLTVLQGVAQHIQNNAETLRSRLVQHETKIELVVDTGLNHLPQTESEMLSVARAFADRIARHVPADKLFLFEGEFSTTTNADRISQSVALMDAFQSYFEYVAIIACGIPSVTLEGTPEDWELLKSRIVALNASDLELSWWTKHLIPLADHFVRAVEGDIDLFHWRNLCKITQRYLVDDLNGWLLKFIPYIKHDKNEAPIHKNPVLELTTYPDTTNSQEGTGGKITGCTIDMLPSGTSCAPVWFLNQETGEKIRTQFIAGLVGVSQSADDLSLRPLTGWMICEGSLIDKLIFGLQQQHEVLPPKQCDVQDLAGRFGHNLPADMVRFYMETGGAVIRMKQGGNLRLLPGSEVKMIGDGFEGNMLLKEQWESNKLSIKAYTDQTRFNNSYGDLLCIATLDSGSSYVFGHDPEARFVGRRYISRGSIFLWTGERTPEAFTPVAHTFTEWLDSILKS